MSIESVASSTQIRPFDYHESSLLADFDVKKENNDVPDGGILVFLNRTNATMAKYIHNFPLLDSMLEPCLAKSE